jgi:hypothetical protein
MYSIWEAKKEYRENNFQFYNAGPGCILPSPRHLGRAAVDNLHERLKGMGADVL